MTSICRRGNLLDDSGRVATNHHIVRYILRYYSSCGNNGVFANGYAWTDNGSDTPQSYKKGIIQTNNSAGIEIIQRNSWCDAFHLPSLRPKNVRTFHLMLCRARLSLWPMLVKLNTIEMPRNLLLHWWMMAPRPVMMTSGKW